MSISRPVFGLMLLAFTAGHAALAGEDKGKPAEPPKEKSVVPHESKTHGALQVKCVGEKTSDWFDVLQKGKRAFDGNPPLLNKTIELAPGAYVVSVNRTERKVTIAAGKKTVLLTGELVVEAKKGTPGWYTPYQGEEAKVTAAPPLLNSPLALFPGKYKVFYRAGGAGNEENLGEVEVKAGRKTVLKR
jgi:hypothetical protein